MESDRRRNPPSSSREDTSPLFRHLRESSRHPYAPMPQFPFDYPPVPQPAPQPMVNPLSLLASLLGSMLGSGGLTNTLLLVLAGFAGLRTFRKATGQKLLLDDNAYQYIVDTLKKLIDPQTPKTPNANP